jgi:hypothetical protein
VFKPGDRAEVIHPAGVTEEQVALAITNKLRDGGR